MQCEEFEIVKKIKVYLDACYTETFIETDKPMYKAGQNGKTEKILALVSHRRRFHDLKQPTALWSNLV